MWATHAEYYRSFNWIYSWYDRTSLGFVMTPTLLEISMGVSNSIIGDASWVYRLTLLSTIFAASCGVYLYVRHLTKDSVGSLLGAFFYVSNPWFLHEIVDGHIDILVSVSLFPLLLLALESRKATIAALLAAFFLAAAHPQAIYTFGFFLIAYFFVALKADKREIVFFSKTLILGAGLSAFYVVPFVFINGFQGFSGLKPWTVEDISDFVMPYWMILISFAAVSSLSILILKYGKGYRYGRFCCVVAIFTAFLAASPIFPILNGIYLWMFRNVPLFSIFRVPTRLMMATMFCVAYMIGIVASITRKAISRIRIPVFKKTVSRGTIYRMTIASMIAGVFITSYSLAGVYSLGNYTPESKWISNYEWLRYQPENHWRVYTLPVTSGWIITPYGNTQDYGALSTLFSDKPVIGTPSKTAASYPLLKHLEYAAINNVTDQWLKLLGALGVKYVTTGPYVNGQEGFLLRQEGMKEGFLAYVDDVAKVYGNPYWIPTFNVVSDMSMLAGGYSDVFSLLRFSFNFSNSALHFLDAEGGDGSIDYSRIVYENLMDYLMVKLDKGIKLHAYQFGVDYTRDPKKDWIKEDKWKIQGELVLNDLTLSISGEHTLEIPFAAEENGKFEVFVRALSGPRTDRGCLTVGNTTICPIWGSHSFKWYHFGEIDVVKGRNILNVRNSGEGNDIDEVVLINKNDLQSQLTQVFREVEETTATLILNDKSHRIFNVTEATGWRIIEAQFDGDGYVLHGTDNAELSLRLVVGNVEYDPAAVIVPRPDNYRLILRTKTEGYVVLRVDNVTISNKGSGEYGLHVFDLPFLMEGAHSIQLYFSSEVYLDNFNLVTVSDSATPFTEVFEEKENRNRVLSVDKIGQTEYILNIENSKPQSYLISSISYDHRWKAYVDGVEISPMRIDDVLLGFQINKTGNVQVRLAFVPQEYVTLGFSVTFATFLIIGAGFLIRHFKIVKGRKEENADRRLLAVV